MVHPVYLLYREDEFSRKIYYPSIRRCADEDKVLAEEEYRILREQVHESEGFDIDFTKFRCAFNYLPVALDGDDEFGGPGTNREFMDRLSLGSLERFNETNSTKYEFDKVIKVNHHLSAGMMFYITFQAKLPSDDVSKEFQARLCYCSGTPDYILCQLKPEKRVHSTEAAYN
ncbi:PREDICTED: uncharacterized protein LOC104699282 [Camelina sativa]|uniref:Uncharacterized protein LOC104699282 n=1 Tax=Camelina sativa TaxID=90675 RepID=A0ABM1RSG5_CAMSA|nr:PREDICTED: uncharacterized protein LOC104699282 [Camelina sativa]